MARHHSRTARRWLVAVGALIVCALLVASAEGFDSDSDFARPGVPFLKPVAAGAGAAVIQVKATPVSRPIQPGFVGLSLEYTTIEPYAGRDPLRINPVLVELIGNLAPGQRPVLRIGGDTTDWTWWPVPHLAKPAGIRYGIGPRFAAVLRTLVTATRARVVLGIDLEADSRRIAAYEAAHLVRALGRDTVAALELGNEPELYGTWPWRVTAGGRRIIGRPPGYGVPAYIRDFGSISRALPAVGLAGPALGGPRWFRHVGEFIDASPRVVLVTLHTYPLQRCDTPLVAPTYPSLAHLLSRNASRGLARRLAATVAAAHGEGLPVRVDEINNVACGGARGLSDTFASALWALDTMFAVARAGVDGVNIHTFQTAAYGLFRTRIRDGRWRARVAPEYYGLALFARAAPPGSRLLGVSGDGGSLRAWATRDRSGVLRTVLINDSATRARVVQVREPGPAIPAAYQLLRAPALRARHGISLGGAGFGAFTETGRLASPRLIMVRPTHGAYVVRLPPAAALMLTVPG